MSLTLGEKLRQAREERGITISEVAEQTRISALYLSCIENDDYRTLPGGIFNKGFIKSFAKYVGVDEQEALQDYASLVANASNEIVDEPKTYRPQVLTDERNSSNLPTIIVAVLILILMTWGVLALVNYIQNQPAQSTNVNSNTNTVSNISLTNTNTENTNAAIVPTMRDLKIEIKADGGDIYVSSVSDGKPNNALIKNGKSLIFEPKETLQLSFARERVQFAQVLLNEKQLTLANPPTKGKAILEINRDNSAQIWESGQITIGGKPAPR